jgi:histone acetyltransferase (RNA polymerase elongator complex component)
MNMTACEILRPFIIPVFIPHAGCPHQCAFCNQRVITGNTGTVPSAETISAHIQHFLNFKKPHHSPVQIAFYGGNFLGLKANALHRLLVTATQFIENGDVDSLRFSTRPDSITPDHLDIIKNFPVKTVELGVQSMDDRVLMQSLRGHTALDTEAACHALRTYGYEVGMQLMIGLPGDSDTSTMNTARKVTALMPDFVRIYPTLVLKNSLLARWYKQGKYTPLSLESGVSRTIKLYLFFRKTGIPVIRMGLQSSEDLDDDTTILAGPYHPAFGHLVHSQIFLDMAKKELRSKSKPMPSVVFCIHPSSLPKMKGLKNGNIKQLKKEFQIDKIELALDASLSPDTLKMDVCERSSQRSERKRER